MSFVSLSSPWLSRVSPYLCCAVAWIASQKANGAIQISTPVSDRGGVDANGDGVYEFLVGDDETFLRTRYQFPRSGLEQHRFALEFDISALPTNSDVSSAALSFSNGACSNGSIFSIHGYSADGSVSLADLDFSNLLLLPDVGNGPGNCETSIEVNGPFDVTAFLQQLVATGATHAGFAFRPVRPGDGEGGLNGFSSSEAANPAHAPQLTISFQISANQPVPEPGTIGIWAGLAAGGGPTVVRRAQRRKARHRQDG